MKKITISLLALALALVATQSAFARKKDNANFGYCDDGKKVADTTKCPKAKSKK